MKKALRGTLKIAGLVLGVIVLLVLAAVLLALFDKPLVRNIIQGRLNKAAGTTARLGRLDYSVFPFRVTLDSLELGQEDAFQKLGLSLGRVEAKGAFWKLVRGTKPAFETIEAHGLSFRLQQKAVSEEPLDIEKVLLQVSDTLAWTKRIAVTDASLSFALLAGLVEVQNLDLTLTPGTSRDVVAYSIGRGDLALKDKAGSEILSAALSSSGRLGLVSPFSVETSLALNKARFTLGGIEDSLDSLSLAVTGRLDKSAHELTVSRLKIGSPGLLDLEGTFRGKSGYGIFLETQAIVRLEDLAAAADLLGSRLPAGLRSAGLRGRAELAGKYMLQRSDRGSKDNLSASLSLEGIELAPVVAGRPVQVRAAGRIDAAGTSKEPRLSADIRSSLGLVALSGLTVAGSDIHLVGSATKSGADITLLDARLAGLTYDASEGKKIAFDKASLTAKGTLDLVRKAGVLTSLEAVFPGLPPLRLSGRYGLGKGAPSELRFEGRGLDLPALRAMAGPFIPAGFAGWDLGGTMDLSLSGRRPAGAGGDWGYSGTISLAGAKFNDPSFTIAGDGLDPVLKLEGTGSPSKGLSFSGSLDISQGESLWKSIYVAWAKHPLKLTAAGRFETASGAIDGLAARILLAEVGSINITGTARLAPLPAFDLATESRLSLGPLYSLYGQAGASEEARMKLEGTLGATLALRKTGDALSVRGRIKLAGMNVEQPLAKTFLLGISADVPILYDSTTAAAGAAAPALPLPESGHIRIDEFRNPLLTLKPVDVSVRAGANALAIEPLALDLFGGRLELGETIFRLDPASGSFHGVGSLALRDIDISKFPVQSPEFKLTGKFQAEFPRLDIGADKIAIAGRGEASVFGGQIVLRDLAVSKPFTAGRSISLDIDLVDLDMKKLTNEVPFGEVTGIVSGEIRGLVISYGQPESFSFRIESVPRKGVSQTFSLKAVDNLTVLSTGQQASGGTSSFWMRFMRGFRYQKLGIVSTLHNDTFTLNGTIHEGGTEYLVKKPALFGISVVNREPDKSISFKEMTSRLKRVGQSGK
ncbi:MAG: hypothetical protein WCC00_14650 [Candidatus Aminicenantales bacterium]